MFQTGIPADHTSSHVILSKNSMVMSILCFGNQVLTYLWTKRQSMSLALGLAKDFNLGLVQTKPYGGLIGPYSATISIRSCLLLIITENYRRTTQYIVVISWEGLLLCTCFMPWLPPLFSNQVYTIYNTRHIQ